MSLTDMRSVPRGENWYFTPVLSAPNEAVR